MKPMLVGCGIVLASLAINACNSDRTNKLEKENQALRAQLASAEARLASVDLESQAKCSKDADAFFVRAFEKDEYTTALVHFNHYSKKLGKCYVKVQQARVYGYGPTKVPTYPRKPLDARQDEAITLVVDVYGGDLDIVALYQTELTWPRNLKGGPDIWIDCRVAPGGLAIAIAGKDCKAKDLSSSEAEFNDATKPYTED